MSVLRSFCTLGMLSAVLVPMAHAQVASSTNYQLASISIDTGGGGTASLGYAAWTSAGPVSGGGLASTNYLGDVGLLAGSDPFSANDPLIFGLSPDHENNAGGAGVTVSGWNFDKFGVGPSVTMDIGGNPSTGLSVLSNTQLTATVPAGDPGPTSVVVTSSLGSGSDPDAWIYTPAVISTAFTQPGGEMDLLNYGSVGNSFITLAAGSAGFAGTQHGPFLLGSPFIFVMYGVPYPGPDGIHTLHANVPNNPGLIGFTIHIQSLEAISYGPIVGQFTNATTVTFQ